jgi:hypothetical protein
MPKILEDAVKAIKQSGSKGNPWAMATSSLQKAGDLKVGSNEPTKQGIARGKMSRKERHTHPLATGGAVRPSLGRAGRHG